METETRNTATPLEGPGQETLVRHGVNPELTVLEQGEDVVVLTAGQLGQLVQWAYDHRGLSGVPF